MADTDLVFSQPAGAGADLVFGADDAVVYDYPIVVDAAFAPLSLSLALIPTATIEVAASFAALTVSIVASYDNAVQRPTVGRTQADWQIGSIASGQAEQGWQDSQRINPGVQAQWRRASRRQRSTLARTPGNLLAMRHGAALWHQDASQAGTQPVRQRHQEALRDRRLSRAARHQEALRVGAQPVRMWHQDGLRDRRPMLASGWQEAQGLHQQLHDAYATGARCLIYRDGRWQEAVPPPAGVSSIGVVPPVFDPCYLPDPHLVFAEGPGGPQLLYVCERHDVEVPAQIIIPVQRAYIVINDVVLQRVDDSTLLHCLSLNLSIDADTWTWGFDATLPASQIDAVMPIAGVGVELLATINTVPFLLTTEKVSRDRSFGAAQRIRVTGRGIAAELASPSAISRSYSNAGALTAQQLAAEALTYNSASLGWALDWQAADWLVPAGAWSFQGSPIEAVARIAEAAGGYVQADRTAKTLHVLPRYGSMPWEWSGLTPDVEVPSSFVSRESTEWLDKPTYNAVYVAGEADGVLGYIKRAGTAGDLIAPMITDPLMTHATAVTARGRAVLGDTGSQLMLGLSAPISAPAGLIDIGALLRFVDGSTARIGLVRSVAISADAVRVRQTLGVECHV